MKTYASRVAVAISVASLVTVVARDAADGVAEGGANALEATLRAAWDGGARDGEGRSQDGEDGRGTHCELWS